MEASIKHVANQASSKVEIDTLMMSTDDIEIYSGKEDEQQNEMNIEEEVICIIKLLQLLI